MPTIKTAATRDDKKRKFSHLCSLWHLRLEIRVDMLVSLSRDPALAKENGPNGEGIKMDQAKETADQ